MSQIVIETDAIKKGILYFFALVGVLAIVSLIVLGAVDRYSTHPAQPAVAPVVVSAPAPTPFVVSTARQYPYVVEFTVLSTTVSNGHYQAVATSGQIFNLPDFSTWNSLWPRDTYSATIVGAEADGTLDVSSVNRFSQKLSVSAVTGESRVIDFTVLAATHINGKYEIVTTDGWVLYMMDYSTWRGMYPGDTYTGTVVGVEVNGALDIGSVNLISTAYYYQRGVYLRNAYAPVYRSSVDYLDPVNDAPSHNPPVYHPPLNKPTQWVGL